MFVSTGLPRDLKGTSPQWTIAKFWPRGNWRYCYYILVNSYQNVSCLSFHMHFGITHLFLFFETECAVGEIHALLRIAISCQWPCCLYSLACFEASVHSYASDVLKLTNIILLDWWRHPVTESRQISPPSRHHCIHRARKHDSIFNSLAPLSLNVVCLSMLFILQLTRTVASAGQLENKYHWHQANVNKNDFSCPS